MTAVEPIHQVGMRFVLDKLCHASLIDAVTGSGTPYRIYPHDDVERLERFLKEAPRDQFQVVISESIFSMDGDEVDLASLAKLKKRWPFVLVLDEAHGSGVYGENGAGYAAEMRLQSAVDVSLVTLSKAVGLMGGAVCGSRQFCEAVVNWGRAYMYSTAISPALAAGIEESIGVMKREPQRQKRVRDLASRVRDELKRHGKEIVEGDSPIIPIVLGSDERALEAANKLREKNLLVIAIRPPTVARGTSRLRITLSCEHSDAEIEELIATLREV
jgi:8-amino-7-oxononanoate synthase